MSRILRSLLVVVSLFAAAASFTACASPTDVVQEDGWHNPN